MADMEKIADRIHEAIDVGVCVDLFMDILSLLKEQEEEIENLKQTCQSMMEGAYLLKEQEAVVRCKDCRFLIDHYGFMNDGYCANMRDEYCVKFKPDKDWFCADGERR